MLTHWLVWCNEAKNKTHVWSEKGRARNVLRARVCKTWSAVVLKYLIQSGDHSLVFFPGSMVKLKGSGPVVKQS